MNTLSPPTSPSLPDADDASGGARERILDAALSCLLAAGLKKTTMDDVARQAGLGRATVYRSFSDKNTLLQAVVIRESLRTYRHIEKKLARMDTLEARFVEGFVMVVQAARQHPLVERLFAIDSERLLPDLTLNGSALLDWGRSFLISNFHMLQAQGMLRPIPIEDTAELMIRLLQSLVLTPGSRVSAQNPESLRRFAREFLMPLLTQS
jgi:AcrR family transcriptional regulator